MVKYIKRLYKNVEKSKRLGAMNDVSILTTKIKRLETYTAFTSVFEIEDVTRFPMYKKLSSYTGLIVSISSSGSVTREN